MKCFRCSNKILKGEGYFKIIEIDENDNKVREDYVHKVCWNNFLKKVGNVEESMSIIRGLKKWLIKQGVLPAEEYVV